MGNRRRYPGKCSENFGVRNRAGSRFRRKQDHEDCHCSTILQAAGGGTPMSWFLLKKKVFLVA
jgi:hypothetical protein